MALSIIKANPMREKVVWEGEDYLRVSEFFCDTIQGEGITAGCPAAFLRLQGCTLNCSYCDTTSVWKSGGEYTFDELFELMEQARLIEKLANGQHLVITGGSPLMQQEKLVRFLTEFKRQYAFKPFIEIENECVLLPLHELTVLVDIWNNSPKLCNSGNAWFRRYNLEVIKHMVPKHGAWFKFVVSTKEDWYEIEKDFKPYMNPDQIILMPQGATRKELESNKEFVVNLAIENNVRYCSREQVVLWDDKIGV